MGHFKNIVAAALIALLLMAPSALAQGAPPALEGYTNDSSIINQVEEDIPPLQRQPEDTSVVQNLPSEASSTRRPRRAQPTATGRLPFTGLDLALLAGAGGTLLLVGFGIRRVTRPAELA